MARIRTIKPEFFTSEDIVSLSPMGRLLYIALWCEADREGRLVWKPKTFKIRYFPADACEIDPLCAELLASGLVCLYGEGLAHIPRFGAHQHVNPRESVSSLPDPHAPVTRRPRVGTRVSTVTDAQGGREGKGKEGDSRVVDGDTDDFGFDDSPTDPAPRPPVAAIPLVDGTEYLVTEPKAAEWTKAFPAVDVPQQLGAMRAWCNAQPDRRKTPRGVERFIVAWLAKAQDRGRSAAPSGPAFSNGVAL